MFDSFSKKKTGERLDVLDFWRSLAVCVMIGYHAVYDAILFGFTDASVLTGAVPETVKFLGGASFIAISGLCVTRSRDPVQRGFFVFLAGLLVSVVTALAHFPVAFGILQLLGICMMLYRPLSRLCSGIPDLAGAACCLAAFTVSAVFLRRVTVSLPFLYPLGLHTPDFFSSDYYPLLPWAFLFYAAAFLGRRTFASARLRTVKLPDFLLLPGKYSLPVYLLHQPVLLLVFLILSKLANT